MPAAGRHQDEGSVVGEAAEEEEKALPWGTASLLSSMLLNPFRVFALGRGCLVGEFYHFPVSLGKTKA